MPGSYLPPLSFAIVENSLSCLSLYQLPIQKPHISIAYLLIPVGSSSHIALFSIFTTFSSVDCLHLLIRLPGAGGYGQVHNFFLSQLNGSGSAWALTASKASTT